MADSPSAEVAAADPPPPSKPASPWAKWPTAAFVAIASTLFVMALFYEPENTAPNAGSIPTTSPEVIDSGFFLGGIQVREEDQGAWLDTLRSQGMNTVSVTHYARQGDWDSNDLQWDAEADAEVVAEVKAAKARGMRVVLIPRVELDATAERNQFMWHGMIMPRTEEQLASWFERYTRFVVGWAEVAERHGIDVLMIGSELNALASTKPTGDVPILEQYFLDEHKQNDRKAELLRHGELVEEHHLATERDGFPDLESYIDRRIETEKAWAQQVLGGDGVSPKEALDQRRQLLGDHWTRLIQAVRGVYGGPIGYAANFDQYHEVGFWGHLDVMGINAYFKLRDRLLPEDLAGSREEALYGLLLNGWRQALDGIEGFRASESINDLPLIFTEMGYTYRAQSTLHPWADSGFSLIPMAEPGAPLDGGEDGRQKLVVWRDQPVDERERALAVRALRQAHQELDEPFLRGILYWKLSTHEYHKDIESFLLWIGEGSRDPLIEELQEFNTILPTDVGPMKAKDTAEP